MQTTIFLAGATGAIGRQLAPLLRQDGHRVFGTTRVPARADALAASGVTPLVLDVFDADAVDDAFARIRPDIVVNLLTDLPQDLNPAAMVEARARNARVWRDGTRNLLAAAQRAGTRRAVAQSLAWLYAPGPTPHAEDDPLAAPDDDHRIVLDSMIALETALRSTPSVEGVVLRFGLLYGPGTSSAVAQGPCPLHVEAAAQAVRLAVRNGRPGVYNVADDNALVATSKARWELGWDAGFRRDDAAEPARAATVLSA